MHIFKNSALLAATALLSVHLNAAQTTDSIAPEAASGFTEKASVSASNYMLAVANPLAAQAGYDVLKRGGSAIDAMVAVQTMLGLVEPQSS
ncbi:MAG: gamma-glutamyltransferase, partial [Pseudomonadales bacterium]|nr:gamma-glutamyltransferase [Pseudomonadales bacterium]